MVIYDLRPTKQEKYINELPFLPIILYNTKDILCIIIYPNLDPSNSLYKYKTQSYRIDKYMKL